MSANLTPWLHDTIQTQLSLGQNWQEERLRAKASSSKPSATVDRKWEGIYHDNGSCIDIIGPLSPLEAKVFVIQTDPLIITDGQHHTEASLSNACRDDLRTRHPEHDIAAGTLCIVKGFTIRYTPYGPPRNHLRLVLRTIDWVGEDHSNKLCADPRRALDRADDIKETLLLLRCTRQKEDHRCFSLQTKVEEDPDEVSYTMAGADETQDEASMDTQMPFGTQMQHPIRSRRSNDGVVFLGANQLGPVLAGNTQRAELNYRSGSSDAQMQRRIKEDKLLKLLKMQKNVPPPPVQSPGRSRDITTPASIRSRDNPATSSPRPRETPTRQTYQETAASQTPSSRGKKRMREVDRPSLSPQHSAKRTSFSEDEPKQSRATELNRFAAECHWMNGLKLDRAISSVPDDQANILQKPESWFKPQPGNRFPSPNIPVQTFLVLNRMADEKAALEGATSSGSYNQTEPSSGSEPSASAPQENDEQTDDSDEESATSLVSWDTSPSPEPPQPPAMPRQGLPPDSSNEAPADDDIIAASQTGRRNAKSPVTTLPTSSNGSNVDLPPSSPPVPEAVASVAVREKSFPPNSTLPESSREGNDNLSPSSLPIPHPVDDVEDEMELETSVPQALGEDLDARPTARPYQAHGSRSAPQSVMQVKESSVVQVKETPYMKGKNGRPVVTVSAPSQGSNEMLEDPSSTSVVRGTYQDFSSSAVEETKVDVLQTNGRNGGEAAADGKGKPKVKEVQACPKHDAQDTSMMDVSGQEEHPLPTTQRAGSENQIDGMQTTMVKRADLLQPEPTPMSAQLPLKDSSSGEQPIPINHKSVPKRKRETKPSVRSLSPRKRFKIPDLGGWKKQRSASTESRPSTTDGQQQHVETKADAADPKEIIRPELEENVTSREGSMSPRHRSLYEDPGPVKRSTELSNIASATKSTSLAQTAQRPIVADISKDRLERTAEMQPAYAQPPREPPSEPRQELQPAPMYGSAAVPAHASPAPTSVTEPEAQPRTLTMQNHAPEKQMAALDPPMGTAPTTIFAEFKAAYPEYAGSIKVFTNVCKDMYGLDQDDKMVPKWMWDDFIIRKQIDYRAYVNECVEDGEDPMPYIRFYKDRIQGAEHKKGIISTKAVLLQALEELGAQPQSAKPPPQQLTVQHTAELPPYQASTPASTKAVYLLYKALAHSNVPQCLHPVNPQKLRQKRSNLGGLCLFKFPAVQYQPPPPIR
ncbi:hypothetical protein E8E13_008215 [Curvularia kusanoi]|uniref:Telomere replication protein EST3 n=1 Tax=Curvularia kusanoi TaxID=90978 RepID=A0A9P4WBW3_CURKU|nr:hypothetical protein E8E13_008215 [Curvularia kusanoi]